jgi:hypothetical protein
VGAKGERQRHRDQIGQARAVRRGQRALARRRTRARIGGHARRKALCRTGRGHLEAQGRGVAERHADASFHAKTQLRSIGA